VSAYLASLFLLAVLAYGIIIGVLVNEAWKHVREGKWKGRHRG
jgi:hypothetical protein